MSNKDEDLLFSHDEDPPTSARPAFSLLTPEALARSQPRCTAGAG